MTTYAIAEHESTNGKAHEVWHLHVDGCKYLNREDVYVSARYDASSINDLNFEGQIFADIFNDDDDYENNPEYYLSLIHI
jgi:hypothetical protein